MKKRKIMLISILVIVMMLAMGVNSYALSIHEKTKVESPYKGSIFTDLSINHWAYKNIEKMVKDGVIKGYPDNSFKPMTSVTYGEFIKMTLIAVTGEDVGNSATGNWAENYYNKGIEKGYYNEYQIEKFKLKEKITRGDMALIASSVLGEIEIKDYEELRDSISDVEFKTKNEYEIIKAYSQGIITGYEDGSFRPEGTLTRAESSVVLARLTDESIRVMPSIEMTEIEVGKEETEDKGYEIRPLTDFLDKDGIEYINAENDITFSHEQGKPERPILTEYVEFYHDLSSLNFEELYLDQKANARGMDNVMGGFFLTAHNDKYLFKWSYLLKDKKPVLSQLKYYEENPDEIRDVAEDGGFMHNKEKWQYFNLGYDTKELLREAEYILLVHKAEQHSEDSNLKAIVFENPFKGRTETTGDIGETFPEPGHKLHDILKKLGIR